MIKNIFFDLDETLIHTSFDIPDQEHLVFSLEADEDPSPYFTIIRPCAKELIEFSRNLVGEENVYILTSAREDYANKINELALFGFKTNKILGREILNKHCWPTAYGGCAFLPHKDLADCENVLIDNLPSKYNENKISFIGLNQTCKERYFQVRDYYGVDFPNDNFELCVKNFLKETHNLISRGNFPCSSCPVLKQKNIKK